eukprot:353323-Chlamydomonas_euryale.AAC.3
MLETLRCGTGTWDRLSRAGRGLVEEARARVVHQGLLPSSIFGRHGNKSTPKCGTSTRFTPGRHMRSRGKLCCSPAGSLAKRPPHQTRMYSPRIALASSAADVSTNHPCLRPCHRAYVWPAD